MTRHFGVLIPSTNTTVEMERRLLPPTYQAHVGRLMSNGGSFSPSRDEDVDYQSRLLGTAKVEMVILAQTSASLCAEDYDDVVTKRMSAGAPYSEAVGATDAYAIGKLGPQNARDAFARIDRPEIEVFVVPGGNFPTMASVAAWKREFGKPVVTTNQASIWAMLRAFKSADRLPAFGRLLAEVPADAS